MRNNINFESTLEKIARIMSRNYNIDVKLEGNMAMTDGKTIYLPMLEDVSDELRSDLEAFLDHEVAHVKFTDFPELKKPKRLKNRFHKELFNALEDSRIEIELPKEYSGSVFNLERLNQKWGAKMNETRASMPWPIRLIICIREIRDGKVPKTDPQIEPILTAIYPQCLELHKCKNTAEVLDATEKLIEDINLAREALSAGLPPIDEDEMEERMKQMRGQSSVELDPDRKKKKSKKAEGAEQFDPATERKDSDDGDESEEGESGDEGDDSEGEQSEGQSQEGSNSGQQNQASMSAEGEGSDKGEGDESADGEGEDGDSEGDAEGEGDEDSDSDSETDGEGKNAEGEGESDADSKGDGDENSDADGDEDGESEVTNPVEDKRNEHIESHESTTGNEGDRSRNKKGQKQGEQPDPQFDGNHKLETRKNYAKGWTENATEKQMLQDGVDKKGSEFDAHVFSSESYMEIQLEKAVQSEPSVRQTHGYYYGKEKEINDKNISLPYSREYDEVIDYTGKGDRAEYASRKRKVMKHINPIKSHLERVLKVKENAKMTPEQERGQLNNRSLAQMCINKNYRTPFKVNTKEDTTNVAVSLVIDCSGSMHGEQIEMARQTALALGEALKAIGIAFEAVGFNTSSNYDLASKVSALSAAETARFNRFGETLRLMIFKKFDSNDLSGVTKAESGGANADGESIVWAAKRLAARKEKRKIMMVLSDGQPSYGGANHVVLAGDLKRVIKMLPKAGIEPIGIGIQTDDPKLFYPDWLMVDDVTKLSTTVMSKLSKLLEKGLRK